MDRARELAAIEGVIEGDLEGLGGFGYIEGVPGIGKTRLLEAARERAEGRGLGVLSATGGELEQDFSYGLVRQLFEREIAAIPPAHRRRLFEGPAALAAVAVGTPEGETQAAQPDSPFPVVHALYWLTANLAARQPLLLIVDDAQWADPPSLRFLDYLAARIEEMRASVFIAARPTEPHVTSSVLAHLRARPRTTLIRPGPLGLAAITAFLGQRFGADPDPAFATACKETTGGNPFLLNELVDALLTDRIEPRAAAAGRVADLGPDTVARSMMLRLSKLPAEASAVADSVAAFGAQAEIRHVAALTDLTPEAVGEAADLLADAHILAADRPLRYVHPILRQAIYRELPPGARARLHAKAAEALIAEERPAAEVAPHLLHTDPAGKSHVVEILRAGSATAAGQGAADMARLYLTRALSEPPSGDALAEVLGALGQVEAMGGDLVQASQHLEEAAVRTAEPLERAARVEIASRARLFQGDLSGAAELLDRELEGNAAIDADTALRLLAHEAAIGLLQPPLAGAAVRRLEELSDLEGDTPAELAAIAELAGSRWLDGWINDAVGLAQRAIADGALLAAEGPASVSFNHAVAVLIDADRYEIALPALETAIVVAREQGSVLGRASLLALRTIAGWRRGALHDVEADARSVLEMLALSPTAVIDPAVLAYLGLALAEHGDLAEAEAAIARSGCGPELPALTYLGIPFFARARLRLAQGRPGDALDDLLELQSRDERLGVKHLRIPWRREAVEASLALGDAAQALRFADEQLELTRRWDIRSARGLALSTKGLATTGEERIDLLSEGAALLADTPARLDYARALVDLGAALRRDGRRADAREPLRTGLDEARRCGATALAERAHAELRTAGARPRRRQFSGLESLTASERRVAELAARGQSNREIAAALFVTVRTVENHLGRAYRKLGVGSRDELPRELTA